MNRGPHGRRREVVSRDPAVSGPPGLIGTNTEDLNAANRPEPVSSGTHLAVALKRHAVTGTDS